MRLNFSLLKRPPIKEESNMKRIKNFIKRKIDASSTQMEVFSGISGAGKNSRATHFGKASLMLGILLEAIEPVVSFAIVIVLACVPTFAQTGGTVFGQDQSMVPNAVRQTIIFLAGIAFLVGAGTIIWGAFQYSRRQECMNCFIGGGFLMVIGGVISLISYLASGRAVTVDRTLN